MQSSQGPTPDGRTSDAEGESAPYHPRMAMALMEGALSRLALAKGHMLRGTPAERARHIHSTMAIIGTLQDALSADEGSEAVSRLDALYDYMQGQLYHADACNDPAVLDEVVRLLSTIKGFDEWLGLHVKDEGAVP